MFFGVFADIKDGDDSGMLKPARSLCLNQETLAIFLFFFGVQPRQQDGLKRNHPVNLRIAGLIDHSYGSATEFGHDLISSKTPGLPGFHEDRCQKDRGTQIILLQAVAKFVFAESLSPLRE